MATFALHKSIANEKEVGVSQLQNDLDLYLRKHWSTGLEAGSQKSLIIYCD